MRIVWGTSTKAMLVRSVVACMSAALILSHAGAYGFACISTDSVVSRATLAPALTVGELTDAAGQRQEMVMGRRHFLGGMFSGAALLLFPSVVPADPWRVPVGSVFTQAADSVQKYYAAVRQGRIAFFTPDQLTDELCAKQLFRAGAVPEGLEYEVLDVHRRVYDAILNRKKTGFASRTQMMAAFTAELQKQRQAAVRQQVRTPGDPLDALLSSERFAALSMALYDGTLDSVTDRNVREMVSAMRLIDGAVAEDFAAVLKGIFLYQQEYYRQYRLRLQKNRIDTALSKYIDLVERRILNFVSGNDLDVWVYIMQYCEGDAGIRVPERTVSQFYRRHIHLVRELENSRELATAATQLQRSVDALNDRLQSVGYYVDVWRQLQSPFSHRVLAYRIVGLRKNRIGEELFSTVRLARIDTVRFDPGLLGLHSEGTRLKIYAQAQLDTAQKTFQAMADPEQHGYGSLPMDAPAERLINMKVILLLRSKNAGWRTVTVPDWYEFYSGQTERHEIQHRVDRHYAVQQRYGDSWEYIEEASAYAAQIATSDRPFMSMAYVLGFLLDGDLDHAFLRKNLVNLFQGILKEHIAELEQTTVAAIDGVPMPDSFKTPQLSRKFSKLLKKHAAQLGGVRAQDIALLPPVDVRNNQARESVERIVAWLSTMTNEELQRFSGRYHTALTGNAPLRGYTLLSEQSAAVSLQRTADGQWNWPAITAWGGAGVAAVILGKAGYGLLRNPPALTRREFLRMRKEPCIGHPIAESL